MAKILDRIRGVLRSIRARRATGDPRWAKLLLENGIDVRMYPCERRPGGLYFQALGVTIPGPEDSVLLKGFQRAAQLHRSGVEFEAVGPRIKAKMGSVTVWVETTEELQILEEICVDGSYHFAFNGPLLIVDIGMNTAYTALYLAATHEDALVFAYEPFSPTFQCARANIELNPHVQERVHPRRFGLSDSDREMDIEYSERWRGSVGVHGVPARLRDANEVSLERCEFRDVVPEIESLCAEYPGRRLVLKIDCEGSEYAVVDRLAARGTLEQVDLMMIECHRRTPTDDPAAMLATLERHGFGCIHLHPDSPDISMLYAVKSMAVRSDSADLVDRVVDRPG